MTSGNPHRYFLLKVRYWGSSAFLCTGNGLWLEVLMLIQMLRAGSMSITSIRKNGWQLTGSPTFLYDHNAGSNSALTFPFAIGVAKTSIINGRPWTFSIEYRNYIESPDVFGPEQQIRIFIAPIVPLPW